MESLRVFLLSLVQAATEFLPVSSSGHLALAEKLLGVDSPGTGLELFLHLGTLVSVCVFYRERIARLVVGVFAGRRDAFAYAGMILLSMVPAGVVGLAAGDALEAVYDKPAFVCACLVFNGLVLTASAAFEHRAFAKPLTPLRALGMGLAQAVAVLPGVSRSGSTITAARLAGVGPADAAEFSFLMSVPVIAGAAALDVAKSVRETGELVRGVSTPDAAIAFATTAIAGYFALRLLARLLRRGRFWVFGPYCILLGAFGLVRFL